MTAETAVVDPNVTETTEPQPQSESALVSTDDQSLTARNQRRKAAILRAVGLDRVPEEQRELALAIARRYDLDLMLKHLVLIEGRPFITRDALLWVAHRSGVFDGMQLTLPPEVRDFPELGKCWYSETTVWRRDMSHPFTFPGRYPLSGQNKKFGPEMSIKVSESMALRRAFNVSAATVEEQWESADVATAETQPAKTLAELVKERAEQIGTVDVTNPSEADQQLAQGIAPGSIVTQEVTTFGSTQPEHIDVTPRDEQQSEPSVPMGLVEES